MHIVDRRLNPKGKSHANRQRFVRVARSEIKEAVERSLQKRGISDVASGEKVAIPTKRIHEPQFRHSSTGGKRDYVLPGNREFVQGDTLPRPQQGGGEGGHEGSPDGEGEDDFQFVLNRDEFLDILFEDLELPDLEKTRLKETMTFKQTRAGFSTTGTPSSLNITRTMRHSLARRISMRRPKRADVERMAKEIAELEAQAGLTSEERRRLEELKTKYTFLARKLKATPYVDPVDLRFNRFEPTPQPTSQAVMFCLMDVSGSMSEYMKDLAKRFFLLLHLFLRSKYEHLDIVFIRHTSEAQEVDEDTFFHSRESGGTVVSSALREMQKIVAERYPIDDWNIYAAQASDGDNFSSDTETCGELIQKSILPLCQYFAYIEVLDEREAPILRSESNASELWRCYKGIAADHENFAMKRVFARSDIFPVFHELFAKGRRAA
ncbi:MAG TPA: YeaH/YhbH family protein [Candidatus Cybelea sp.]|nr:YeaH/YhbH family protein [Candidatus Cybelea sp.]